MQHTYFLRDGKTYEAHGSPLPMSDPDWHRYDLVIAETIPRGRRFDWVVLAAPPEATWEVIAGWLYRLPRTRKELEDALLEQQRQELVQIFGPELAERMLAGPQQEAHS
jgi:hypothetical protein